MSLNKVKQLKQYLIKPAYSPREIEKTRSRGTIQLSNWIRSLVAFYETNNLKKKDLRKVKNSAGVAYETTKPAGF